MRSVTVRLLYDEVSGRLAVEIDDRRTECANNEDAMRLIRQAMDKVVTASSPDGQFDGASGSVFPSL
jgi:hypothetical protein